MTRFFCILFCTLVGSACVLAPPFWTGEAVFSYEESPLFGEQYLEFDFVNLSDKTVESLEVTVRTESGEPLWACIQATIPPEGSTRVRTAFDCTDETLLESFAITRIIYTDGEEFIDSTGMASGAWW